MTTFAAQTNNLTLKTYNHEDQERSPRNPRKRDR